MNVGTTTATSGPNAMSVTPPTNALKRCPMKRRGLPLLAATAGRQGTLSRSAGPRRRGFPGPASAPGTFPGSTPVPTPAHPTPRAIRVLRSPR